MSSNSSFARNSVLLLCLSVFFAIFFRILLPQSPQGLSRTARLVQIALPKLSFYKYPRSFSESTDPYAYVPLYRAGSRIVSILFPSPRSCKVSPIDSEFGRIYEISADGYLPREATRGILYVHGGGFVFGDLGLYQRFVCSIAKEMRQRVFFPIYPLAPEVQIPAQRKMLVNSLIFLWENKFVDPRQTILMGDSAGAGLSILILQHLINSQSKILPISLGLISPFIDVSLTNEFLNASLFSRDLMFSEGAMRVFGQLASGRNTSRLLTPDFNPALGSFVNFPPIISVIGTEELFFADAMLIEKKAKLAQVHVNTIIGNGMPHDYLLMEHFMPESRRDFLLFIESLQNVSLIT